jgi:hypothetical protein
VTLHRERLLYGARTDALALAESGYTPPVPATICLPGEGATATDVVPASRAARTLGNASALTRSRLLRSSEATLSHQSLMNRG